MKRFYIILSLIVFVLLSAGEFASAQPRPQMPGAGQMGKGPGPMPPGRHNEGKKKSKKQKKEIVLAGQTLYCFGISGSFCDSIVFFTDIQSIPGMKVQKKTGFIDNAGEYSVQMKDYIEKANSMTNRTCVFFSYLKKKDAEKEYVALKKRYSTDNTSVMRYIGSDEFQFKKVDFEVSE